MSRLTTQTLYLLSGGDLKPVCNVGEVTVQLSQGVGNNQILEFLAQAT